MFLILIRSSTPENGLGSNEDEQYNKIPHSPQVDVPLASDVTYASQLVILKNIYIYQYAIS